MMSMEKTQQISFSGQDTANFEVMHLVGISSTNYTSTNILDPYIVGSVCPRVVLKCAN